MRWTIPGQSWARAVSLAGAMALASAIPSQIWGADEASVTSGNEMPPGAVAMADNAMPPGVDIPQAAPGTGARRVDAPEDFGLMGGPFDRPVTLDFTDQPLDLVLRLIASYGNINIIFDPGDINGSVTLHWEDVPLGIALEQILNTYDLGYVQEPGNILRIVPAAQLGHEAIELKTEVITLNWVRAEDLSASLQPFRSQTGQVQANTESNQIIVTDTPPRIAVIRDLISQLDIPEKQVMIEIHLVDILEDFSKAHGVNWDLFKADSSGASNTRITEFFRNTSDEGIPQITELANAQAVDAFGVFEPISASDLISVGDTLSIFGDEYNLSLDVQADSSEDYAQVLANPRVNTLNNLEASIRIEEQIPYVQGTTENQQGNISQTIVFEEAGEEITVVPTITANGYIRMEIEVFQKIFRGRVVDAQLGNLSPPQIDEREANTNVIVADGKTVVLGGLEGHRTLNSESGVPWFRETPVLRWFFQQKLNNITKSSLYLFVTPKIVPVDQNKLMEDEKFWFDGVDRVWDLPDRYFDDWDTISERQRSARGL